MLTRRQKNIVFFVPVIDSVSAAVPVNNKIYLMLFVYFFTVLIRYRITVRRSCIRAEDDPSVKHHPQMVVPVFVAPRSACRCFRVCEKSKPSIDIGLSRAATLNPKRPNRVDFTSQKVLSRRANMEIKIRRDSRDSLCSTPIKQYENFSLKNKVIGLIVTLICIMIFY